MGFLNIFDFGVVYLICTLSFTNADTCVAKTPCSCEFSNGTGIDLTPAISSEFYTADIYAVTMIGTQYEKSTYYYNPCYDVTMNVSQPNPENTCTSPLSICRQVSTMNLLNKTDSTSTNTFDAGSYEFMAQTNMSQFSDQGNSIIYPNGPSETIVLLECAETENKLQVYSIAQPGRIVLSFYSKDACLKQLKVAGRS